MCCYYCKVLFFSDNCFNLFQNGVITEKTIKVLTEYICKLFYRLEEVDSFIPHVIPSLVHQQIDYHESL